MRRGWVLGVFVAMVAVACGDSSASGGDELGDRGSEEASAGESGEQDGGSEASEQDGESGEQDGESGTQDGGSEDSSGSGAEATAEESGESTGDTADTSDTDGTGGDASTTGSFEFCDKVDFLFVIDSSISMLPEQEALSAAFPGFIDAIEGSLATDDHIMVTDTDVVGWCAPWECADPDSLHETCEGAEGYACTMDLEACDITLGAGVVEPAGQGASNSFCDPFGGNRYMIEEEPDKVGTFDCVAHVGLAGNPVERPIDAIVQAVSPELNALGGCNEGFLRDDALLVVTFISDDDDMSEVNSPQMAYEALLAAKGDTPGRTVVLGLTPGPDNNCSGTPGAGEHWVEFIDMYGPLGMHGPSCADDYVSFFEDAVDIIVQACMQYPT